MRLWDSDTIADLRVAAAELERDQAKEVSRIDRDWRAQESTWRQNSHDAALQYQLDRKAWEARRNPGPGAPVRVCDPATATAATAAADPAAPAGIDRGTAAAGVLSEPVPVGADAGPMLRTLVSEAERLSDQVRALLAERRGLSAQSAEPIF
jgi:hypothetical protein